MLSPVIIIFLLTLRHAKGLDLSRRRLRPNAPFAATRSTNIEDSDNEELAFFAKRFQEELSLDLPIDIPADDDSHNVDACDLADVVAGGGSKGHGKKSSKKAKHDKMAKAKGGRGNGKGKQKTGKKSGKKCSATAAPTKGSVASGILSSGKGKGGAKKAGPSTVKGKSGKVGKSEALSAKPLTDSSLPLQSSIQNLANKSSSKEIGAGILTVGGVVAALGCF